MRCDVCDRHGAIRVEVPGFRIPETRALCRGCRGDPLSHGYSARSAASRCPACDAGSPRWHGLCSDCLSMLRCRVSPRRPTPGSKTAMALRHVDPRAIEDRPGLLRWRVTL